MTLQRARLAHSLGIELNRNMNVEISNPLKEQKSAERAIAFTLDHELLITTIQEAINRSTQRQRPILASFTQKIEWHDTIQAFSGARLASLGRVLFLGATSRANNTHRYWRGDNH